MTLPEVVQRTFCPAIYTAQRENYHLPNKNQINTAKGTRSLKWLSRSYIRKVRTSRLTVQEFTLRFRPEIILVTQVHCY